MLHRTWRGLRDDQVQLEMLRTAASLQCPNSRQKNLFMPKLAIKAPVIDNQVPTQSTYAPCKLSICTSAPRAAPPSVKHNMPACTRHNSAPGIEPRRCQEKIRWFHSATVACFINAGIGLATAHISIWRNAGEHATMSGQLVDLRVLLRPVIFC